MGVEGEFCVGRSRGCFLTGVHATLLDVGGTRTQSSLISVIGKKKKSYFDKVPQAPMNVSLSIWRPER